jgi:predicted GIY-YIG superfamily endonuclease
MEACIYVVKNITTSQIVYVGKTSNPSKRWGRHKTHKGGRLYNYMSENGGCLNFELAPVIWFETEEMAFEAEAYFIQLCLEQQVSLINQDRGGIGTISGRKASKETIEKLSKMQKKRYLDPEYKEKISKIFQENKEVWLSKLKQTMSMQEVRKKISDARKQQYKLLTDEARKELTKKATEAIRGKKLTQNRKNQISTDRIKWFNEHPEARIEVGNHRRGKRHTNETKISIGQKKRILSDEQIVICRKLHLEGISMKKISERLGVSIKPVFNAINAIGIYGIA